MGPPVLLFFVAVLLTFSRLFASLDHNNELTLMLSVFLTSTEQDERRWR